MIPTIGMMVAAYALARLLQVSIEHSAIPKKPIWLLLISIPAIGVIGLCALELLVSGTSATDLLK